MRPLTTEDREPRRLSALRPAKDHLPTARLWRESLTRFTVSDWHRETVKDLNLPIYPSTAKLTLDTYGRWLPGSEDRARAEAQVTRAEISAILSPMERSAEQGRDVSAAVANSAG